MLKMEQLWDKMREKAEAEGALEILAYNGVEAKLKNDVAAQQARFDSYLPARPADYQHKDRCQITRFKDARMACTCKSNMDRRRQQVVNAARAGDTDFRDTLGGMESHAFDLAVKNKW